MALLNTPVGLYFIVCKIRKQKNIGETCYEELTTEDMIIASKFLKIKNKGKLINTSVDVRKLNM